MKPLWAVQKFAVHDDDGKGMEEAFNSLGIPYHILDLPPFDYDKIDPIEYDGPVIPYGGTKFIDKIKDDDGWFCVFNDNFKYSIGMNQFGELMFNGDGRCMKMKEFCPTDYKDDKYVFVRPDRDIKEFAGNVVKPKKFMQWYRQIMGKGWGVNEETDIIVAPASKIDYEWRTFVVDEMIVGGSQYRKNHFISISPDLPCDVIDYVYQLIAMWQPAEFFVMDICSVNGDLSILEFGDLHSAGWYATDKRAVIEAVSDFAVDSFC